MNISQISLLFLISLLAFAPYLFSSGLFGYDSYAFLNAICTPGYAHNPATVTTPFANLLFLVLPCDILTLKLLLFVVMLSSVVILAKTGELINEREGWMAGAFVFLAPIFMQVFAKLENDTFAIPFLFLGIYWLIKADQFEPLPRWLNVQRFVSKKYVFQILAILSFLIALGFWNGAAFMLLGMVLMEGWILFLALIPLAFYGKFLFDQITISNKIAENAEVLGYFGLFILIAGFLTPVLAPLTLFLGIISFLNGKFVILVIPLLALSLLKLINKIPRDKELWIRALFIFAFAMAFASGLLLFSKPLPSPSDWEAVDYALDIHNSTGKDIKNDFQLGYLLDYRGYESINYGFLDETWTDDLKGYVAITQQELECEILREIEPYYVYDC